MGVFGRKKKNKDEADGYEPVEEVYEDERDELESEIDAQHYDDSQKKFRQAETLSRRAPLQQSASALPEE